MMRTSLATNKLSPFGFVTVDSKAIGRKTKSQGNDTTEQ
jgi:hypothetical protein